MGGRRAAVLGATGLVGGHLLDALLADGRWSAVVAVGRRPVGTAHPRLVQVAGDLLADGPWTAALAVDDVFCCLGTTIRRAGSRQAFRAVDHGAVVRAARAAAAGGARCFAAVSSLGADPASRVFYNRVKGEMERDVARLPFAGCYLFRPSLLRGARREVRLGERLALWLTRPLGPLLGRWRPIPAAAVAAALVRVVAAAPPGVHVFESRRIAALAAGSEPPPGG